MSGSGTSAGTPPNLYGLDRDGLAGVLAAHDVPAYRSRQLYRALYHGDRLDLGALTELPGALRDRLRSTVVARRPVIASSTRSADGSVRYLLDLPRGGELDRVEAVSIPSGRRMTFCISSQVGCAFGCAFCMTARLGFGRHLDPGEIVGQVAALVEATGTGRGRFNIVFMGMGEPLHNLDGVVAALALLFDEEGFGLGANRVTVSTVGLAKGIRALAKLPVAPRLAVSLVTADQAVRETIMPVARSVDVDELAEAVREFGAGRRHRPTFECVMLEGVNDSEEDATRLVELAQRAAAKVNLIEFNPTPELPFRPATEESLQRTLRALKRGGVVGTVRRSRGGDVDAACGQLAFSRRAAGGA